MLHLLKLRASGHNQVEGHPFLVSQQEARGNVLGNTNSIVLFLENTITLAQQAEAEALDSQTSATSPLTNAFNMDKFRAFTNTVSSTVSSSVTPFATRSQQWIKEQTGNAGEKTELPHDYVELETRIDALKQTHQKLLAATSQYANEAYDYPPNIRESFQDLGKSISEKV